jgi:hypothetical protein
MGNLPRSPCAPVGAFLPALNGLGCASPFQRVGQLHGGSVTSPVLYPNRAKTLAFASHQNSDGKPRTTGERSASSSRVIALSVEIVAKPQEAHRVETAIPKAFAGALKDVTGFAGCLVMISDQEARLVTVVTLWTGEDRANRCRENLRWVHALLAPYVDRCLRVQTMLACLPVSPPAEQDTNSPEACFMIQEHSSTEGNICVA